MIRAISVLLLSLGLILRPPVAHADDLSTRIAAANAYLATRPGTVGYVLRDRSTGAAYRNPDAGALIWTASTIKLAIVVDLLARTYAGQIRLSDQDRQLISAMLHSSDNDAADTLWDRYGGSMPSGWTRWILEQFEFGVLEKFFRIRAFRQHLDGMSQPHIGAGLARLGHHLQLVVVGGEDTCGFLVRIIHDAFDFLVYLRNRIRRANEGVVGVLGRGK